MMNQKLLLIAIMKLFITFLGLILWRNSIFTAVWPIFNWLFLFNIQLVDLEPIENRMPNAVTLYEYSKNTVTIMFRKSPERTSLIHSRPATPGVKRKRSLPQPTPTPQETPAPQPSPVEILISRVRCLALT